MGDAAPILIWETDATGVTFVNQHYLDFFGVSFGEIKEMGWSSFVHPDDLEGYVVAYVEAYTSRQPYAYECRFRRADGCYRWLRNTGRPVGADRLAGGSVDVTDLIELQSALKESEEQLRLVKETGRHLVILTTDAAGTITSWSLGAETAFGWSADEVIGQNAAMLFVPEDQATGVPEEELQGAARDGCSNDERWHLTKSDGRVFLNGSVHPLLADPEGRSRGFIKVAIDDTRRRESEEELHTLNADLERTVAHRTQDLEAARTSLEVALAAADMGGWDIDLATGDARRTLRHDRIFGYKALLADWNVEAFLSHVQPGHRNRIATTFEQAAETGNLEFECPIDTVDGDERWITAKGRMAYDDAGTPIRMSGVVFDITERKETEAQLAQAQKMEAVGQLTGGVAHDFNNLLTVIRGSVDLLRRPGLSDDRRARYIDAIGETADRATRLTAQLLAFARRQALAPATFDSGASVEEVGTIVRTLVGARITFTIATPDEPCFVVADRGQFDTAVINMSVNARDAMDGQGDLTILVAPVSGIPATRAHPPVSGDYVAITIRDTGSGIDLKKMERIFEPFYTTKGPGHGTGLGLSQVFGFAKQSDGDIRVESVVGEGSTFTLYLPRARHAEAEIEQEAKPEPFDGEGARVLLVEDNEEVGEFAAQALKELGYRCVLATNAAQALSLLRKDRSQFDVVFSDVVMPGMNGLEMGQEIRRLHADLPVILTSGYSHVLAQNGQHGFELLHKPYSVEQLSHVLRKSVRRSKAD